ncbi:MAG: hypothetical protein AAFV69_04935 [Pseudomonadota bacterium]
MVNQATPPPLPRRIMPHQGPPPLPTNGYSIPPDRPEFPSVVRRLESEKNGRNNPTPATNRFHRKTSTNMKLVGVLTVTAALSAFAILAWPDSRYSEVASQATGSAYTWTNPIQWFAGRTSTPEDATTTHQRDLFLARSTLIALDHAVRTGNFSVLHNLSDPAFQRQNPPDKLAAIFSSLRKSGIDLTFAAVQPLSLDPVNSRNRSDPLRVSGRFATNTKNVQFDMRFKVRNGLWRLIGIVVAPSTNQQQASLAPRH